MEPTEALRRVAVFCGMGTGMRGYYPPPGIVPKPPFCTVFLTGGQVTYRGGEQEMLLRAEIRLCVADVNDAEKVVGPGDRLITKLLDRFRPDGVNAAYTLVLPGEPGSVKHCHIARGGDEPFPFTASQLIPGWGATFYGAVFPVEIKLVRTPEQIV